MGPGQLIALAEESGLIVPIGRWVMRQACAQIRASRQAGLVPPLCKLGTRVAIDDFGAGCASLSCLKRVAAHVRKLGRPMTAHAMRRRQPTRAQAHSLIGLAA